MKKCESIARFVDLEDGHLYNPGDPFPYDGRELPAERIAELCGTQNKAGFALIKVVETPNEEKPVEKAETPKKVVRSRKKTT